jgi:hypothetical protein
MGEALAYLAAGVTAAWGVAHIMPTGRVVAGFGNLSKDNRLILTMDWVAEGFTLVLLGVLVAVVTMRGGSADPVTQAVYAVAAGALLVFAVWTAATAARGWVIIFFKICPVVKSLAAALLTAAIAL